MENMTKKVKVWFWRLMIALGLVGVALSQAGPVAADPLLPPLEGSYSYVWGG